MIIHFPNRSVDVMDSDLTLTDFESSIIYFCSNWLSGQEEFNVNTSGSTGIPKTISISRVQAIASASITELALGLLPHWNALLCLAPNTIAGKMMMVRAMHTGMNLYVVEPSHDPFAGLPNNTKIDFVAMVPLQLQYLIDQKVDLRPYSLKKILLGGAPVSDYLLSEIQQLPTPVYSSYGMTETVSHIALRLLNTDKKQYAYHTLPNIEIQKDERDCLCIKGEITQQKWIVTNDIVEFLGEGKFIIKGRADDIINSGGVKIQLQEVEALISNYFRAHHITSRFFAWGLPDKLTDKKLVLVIESKPWSSAMQMNVLNNLKTKSAKFKSPKEILFLDRFIYTPSQKIDRLKSVATIAIPRNL